MSRFESVRAAPTIDQGVDSSVGSVGDAYDALAETTVGSFKNELIRRQGPWRDVDHVEIETLNWVDWLHNERPHETLDDLTPAAAQKLHNDHRTALANARCQETESPDTPGRLTTW